MTIERKVGMGIAGQPTGPAADVAEVFSTFLYTAGSAERKVNGIDLAGEGGMVWTKSRTSTGNHRIQDTVRGTSATGHYKNLKPNSTAAEETQGGITTFHSDGYSIDNSSSVTDWNTSTNDYASWTFRKKEKFFDIVTYTGNSGTSQTIAHGLNGPVGMILVKSYAGASASQNWMVFHAGNGATKYQVLNDTTAAATATSVWNDTAPTDTHFTVGSDSSVNNSNKTYVAYLFADNSSEDADDQMIKCGSFTSNTTGQSIDLGWEPQFVLVKSTSNAMSWYIFDTMRGIVTGGNDSILAPNDNLAEETATNYLDVTSTGFISHFNALAGSRDYIYMAIRAPMMKEPEAATDVFNTIAYTGGGVGPVSGFKTDFNITGQLSGSDKFYTSARITGTKTLKTNTTAAEADQGGSLPWDRMDGVWNTSVNGYTLWFWQRAKGYMDVVAYTGNSTSGRTVAHSLSVIPEMIWIKQRDTTSDRNWNVYHKSLATNNIVKLNLTAAESYGGAFANVSLPTDSNFTVTGSSQVNYSPRGYIAYLFASLAGISKVGSFVGNGSNQTIDCGFSAGSRFILIKRTNAGGDWFFWDSLRGIVAGNDPHVSLNTTAAQVTNDDSVDPHNSGFIVNQVSATNINVLSATYIFYAIA